MKSSFVGIDIGGTGVKVAAGRADGWCLGISERYIRPGRDALRDAIRQAAERAGVDRSVDAIGLCVPGIPSDDGSRIEIAVNLPGLEGWDFQELAHDAVGGMPEVHRTNDAAAATADWVRSHSATGRVAGVVVGTGVGLSVIDNGIPVSWTDGAAGHLGQIDVTIGDSTSAPLGPDGGRGGLEAYVGAEAVLARGGIEAAFAPNAPALEALSRAIRIVHAMYRPGVVVLLGGIGIRLAATPTFESTVRRDLTSIARPGWRLAFGDDDHHAARGAARFAAEKQ